MRREKYEATQAALQFEDALAALDGAVRSRDFARAKLDKLGAQMADLIETFDGTPNARALSTLKSLRHKFRFAEKALERTQADCARARRAYDDLHEVYVESMDRMHHYLVAQQDEMDVAHRISAASERAFTTVVAEVLNRTDRPDERDLFKRPAESYDYIPFAVPKYLETLIRLDALLSNDPDYDDANLRHRPVSYLEVGCGHGRNILLTRAARLIHVGDYHGFDINPDLVELGRKAFGLNGTIQVADALDYDYAPHDVIFSYRPIRTAELQAQLEARIAETMPMGSYLIAPLAEDLTIYPELSRVCTALDIWKKTG